jgi:hypothetical protein
MKRKRPPDEPGFLSTRTDAETYADNALASIRSGAPLSERQQGYVREMLISAFDDGERQGEFRALWILIIAEKRTRNPESIGLIRRCLALLAPDIQGWEIDE